MNSSTLLCSTTEFMEKRNPRSTKHWPSKDRDRSYSGRQKASLNELVGSVDIRLL